MIHFEFEREKLTQNEAQIVELMLALHMSTQLQTVVAATQSLAEPTRTMHEAIAGITQRLAVRWFPALSLRWEWRERDAPPS